MDESDGMCHAILWSALHEFREDTKCHRMQFSSIAIVEREKAVGESYLIKSSNITVHHRTFRHCIRRFAVLKLPQE